MKNLLMLSACLLLACTLSAKNSDTATTTSNYKHELGIDVTGLLRQVIIAGSGADNYDPLYFVSYRRHFNKGNLRFGFGGNFSYVQNTPFGDQDPQKFFNSRYGVNFRLGYEWFTNFGKKWQLFYGIDFRPGYFNYKSDAFSQDATHYYGQVIRSAYVGVAPILGVRYKITDRISILVESNFAVFANFNHEKDTFIPRNSSIPDIPDYKWQRTFSIRGSYTAPVSLLLTFDL